MARRAFYSFHFQPDNWRASQVRNMGKVEGDSPVSDNDWEAVKKGGDAAIQRWIDNQLDGKSVSIVLVGTHTAGRKWIDYEIQQSWKLRKGILGIHIHNLKDSSGNTTTKGNNPFSNVFIQNNQKNLGGIIKCYDPPYFDSSQVYTHIKDNLESWVEEAIRIRDSY